MSEATRRFLSIGAIAGLTMSFMGGIGMIETFSRRTLIDPFLNMGELFLWSVPVVAGVMAARPQDPTGEAPPLPLRTRITKGLAAGALAGVIAALFVWIVQTYDMFSTFPNMRPAMVQATTSGLAVPAGYLLLVAISAVGAILGAVAVGLPDRPKRGLRFAVAWVIGMALLQPVVTDMLDFSRRIVRLIYGPQGGLNLVTAVVIAAVAWWASLQLQGKTKAFAGRVQESDPKSRLRISMYALIALAVIVLPMLLGGILNELLINVALFVLMGLGLNIVVGLAGLLDLGYVAFFAVGAYGMAVLTSPLSDAINPQLSWWAALPIVLVFAAIAGLFVGTPVLRMRGDYLAIVTLGFGEIVRILLLSDWLTPVFGGAQGIRRIPGIPVAGNNISGVDPELFIYLTAILVAIAAYISYRAQNSRVGRSWAAMREDESVAEAIGVNTVNAKLLAFVTGAIIASMAGALFSAKVGTVFTNSFDVLVSIVILVVVIVGGMGRIAGVFIGSVVLIGVLGGPKSPGLLVEFAEYKLLIYGAILVFMMLKKPEGLIPSARRTRELHQEEFMQDAWFDKGGEFTGDEAEVAT